MIRSLLSRRLRSGGATPGYDDFLCLTEHLEIRGQPQDRLSVVEKCLDPALQYAQEVVSPRADHKVIAETLAVISGLFFALHDDMTQALDLYLRAGASPQLLASAVRSLYVIEQWLVRIILPGFRFHTKSRRSVAVTETLNQIGRRLLQADSVTALARFVAMNESVKRFDAWPLWINVFAILGKLEDGAADLLLCNLVFLAESKPWTDAKITPVQVVCEILDRLLDTADERLWEGELAQSVFAQMAELSRENGVRADLIARLNRWGGRRRSPILVGNSKLYRPLSLRSTPAGGELTPDDLSSTTAGGATRSGCCSTLSRVPVQGEIWSRFERVSEEDSESICSPNLKPPPPPSPMPIYYSSSASGGKIMVRRIIASQVDVDVLERGGEDPSPLIASRKVQVKSCRVMRALPSDLSVTDKGFHFEVLLAVDIELQLGESSRHVGNASTPEADSVSEAMTESVMLACHEEGSFTRTERTEREEVSSDDPSGTHRHADSPLSHDRPNSTKRQTLNRLSSIRAGPLQAASANLLIKQQGQPSSPNSNTGSRSFTPVPETSERHCDSITSECDQPDQSSQRSSVRYSRTRSGEPSKDKPGTLTSADSFCMPPVYERSESNKELKWMDTSGSISTTQDVPEPFLQIPARKASDPDLGNPLETPARTIGSTQMGSKVGSSNIESSVGETGRASDGNQVHRRGLSASPVQQDLNDWFTDTYRSLKGMGSLAEDGSPSKFADLFNEYGASLHPFETEVDAEALDQLLPPLIATFSAARSASNAIDAGPLREALSYIGSRDSVVLSSARIRGNWMVTYVCLVIVRRLLIFHGSLLNDHELLSSLFSQISACVEDTRPTVARYGIMVVKDVYHEDNAWLKRLLDMGVQHLLVPCIKRSVDHTNLFLAEAAAHALSTMIDRSDKRAVLVGMRQALPIAKSPAARLRVLKTIAFVSAEVDESVILPLMKLVPFVFECSRENGMNRQVSIQICVKVSTLLDKAAPEMVQRLRPEDVARVRNIARTRKT